VSEKIDAKSIAKIVSRRPRWRLAKSTAIALWATASILLNPAVDDGALRGARAEQISANRLIVMIMAVGAARHKQGAPIQDVTDLAIEKLYPRNRREFAAWVAALLGAEFEPRFGDAQDTIFFDYAIISKYSGGFMRGDEIALTYSSESADALAIKRVAIVNRLFKY
jgi:hypothetical protein